jgi:hypothetical protein
MHRIVGASCVVALLLAAVPARADEDADLRAVVVKALRASGGADTLKKFKASVSKSKGKFYGMGEGIDYTGETSLQLPNRFRTEVEGEAGGQKFKFVQIIDGDKGWRTFNDMTQDLDREALAEGKEQLYVQTVTHLTPLTDKAFKLSSLGEVKVGDRAAVGVRVEHRGHRDVSLFFDKDKGLLIKSESRVKDLMAGGQEYTSEVFYGDYKRVEGVMVPYKITIKRDGKRFVEAEVTEVKLSEKLDDSVFAKP